MADVILSESEKLYIINGVKENVRSDGRGRKDFRLLEIETDFVSNTNGSARVRLANTDILVGVKADLETPSAQTPDEGRLEFFVDCSANATPEFEGRGGEEIAVELSSALTCAYSDSACIDLKSLCLLKGRQCWAIYVDIVVLECGGNLFDAVGFAVKAALYNTKIPKIHVTLEENMQIETEISDDPYEYDTIDISKAPCFITAAQLGHHFIMDPSSEEEACSRSMVVLGVTQQETICFCRNIGGGSIHSQTLFDIFEAAVEIGRHLNIQLMKKLKDEEQLGRNKRHKGFLE
uniref:Ribosomal RNA-processing protein 42 n=1 Tax=Strigamia maritima TaxID=126957 RepID=T1ISB9_STRMM